jgi:hypothetical protein
MSINLLKIKIAILLESTDNIPNDKSRSSSFEEVPETLIFGEYICYIYRFIK